jgi:hypothetical protein
LEGDSVTPRKRSVANLTARGLTQQQVAELLGCSAKTVQRDLEDPEVSALVDSLGEPADDPAVATLRSALLATRRDGAPDWNARVSAARALLAAPEDPAPSPSNPAMVNLDAVKRFLEGRAA